MFRLTANNMFSNTAPTQHKLRYSNSHSAFNVLNMMMGIGYKMEWWPHSLWIFTYTSNCTCQNAYSISKAWFHLPTTPSIQPTSLNHPQILCYCQEPASPLFMIADSSIIQLPLWFSPKSLNLFVTSCLQPDINASCRQ